MMIIEDFFLSNQNLEFDNLRNDHTLLLLEKETLDKVIFIKDLLEKKKIELYLQIIAEYQLFKEEMTVKLTESELTIQNLRDEIEKLKKIQEQKQHVKSVKKR